MLSVDGAEHERTSHRLELKGDVGTKADHAQDRHANGDAFGLYRSARRRSRRPRWMFWFLAGRTSAA